jgi:hypothetical protein
MFIVLSVIRAILGELGSLMWVFGGYISRELSGPITSRPSSPAFISTPSSAAALKSLADK